MHIETEVASPPLSGGVDPAIAREAADAVRDTIYRATILLDAQKWDDWLALCHADFNYDIKSWSPEINYDMTYLHASRKDMESLIRLLPKHNTDHSPLTRHTSVYTVDVSDDGATAKAVSAFVVYQHMLDGTNSHIDSGESRLFLVGKYYDTFRIEQGRALFLSRETRLENRRLDKGSHWPI
ncbi:nuclear transport factor 2 family protein [Hansschlegelia sp. KR7-227]|uniref:nuclear transport factor 2 family protein n=1 Tax=Hansschlegelia sp. KR7-227 TaxID=3400914 RepID=UPI003C0F34D8